MVPPALRDQQDQPVLPARRDLALRVSWDPQGSMDLQEMTESPDLRVDRDQQALPELRVPLDQWDLRAMLARMESMVL